MAKVNFTKLGIKKVNEDVKTILFNNVEIEVKQYLPTSEKLAIIGRVVGESYDGNRFHNQLKVDIYLCLEVLYNYTNITFTDKQKEDVLKLYDLVDSSGLLKAVIDAIPQEERDVLDITHDIAEGFYKQMNSVYGIMDTIANDYSQVGADVESLGQEIANPNNLTLLKDIVTKLG